MDTNKFLQSKTFRNILVALGLVVVILIAFGAGLVVGYNKANFSYEWGEYYNRNFGGPPRGPLGLPLPQPSQDFTSGHGAFGTILAVQSSSLTLSGDDGAEKNVLFSSSTIIREFRNDISASDLRVSEPIVVIGSPTSDGQIQAQFIRVFQ